MIPDHRIGSFVTKHTVARAKQTRPHLVESIVAEEPVTRCGRRLRKVEGTFFEWEFAPHLPVCKRCLPQ